MKMNIANRLTILRILLIVPFIIILVWKSDQFSYRLIAFVIFAIASLTDFLDGYLARKFNLITNFGKLMDPLADKILVLSSLLIFVELKYVPAWMVIVIITRDFLINGIRSLAASKGHVLPAGGTVGAGLPEHVSRLRDGCGQLRRRLQPGKCALAQR